MTKASLLRVLRALHETYLSVPVEINDGLPGIDDDGWHDATIDEQASRMRWWCDACNCDAPCRQYQAITAVIGGASGGRPTRSRWFRRAMVTAGS